MVFFTIKGKRGEYPYTVLKGKNFYLKAQELMFGSNNFRDYPTLKEELSDLKIQVIEIDIKPEEINRRMAVYFSLNKTVNSFQPIFEKTIKNNYETLDLEQSFDFYQNLVYNFGEEKLNDIVYLVIYKNVSKKWISVFYELDMYEVDFIFDYLAVYYNYLNFEGRE